MAKGANLKKEIQNKILETFPGSFLYNDGKEIRICGSEGGEQLQIKCVLTCAKECVESGTDTAIPGAAIVKTTNDSGDFPSLYEAVTPERTTPVAPTEEEKQNVANLLKSLGF